MKRVLALTVLVLTFAALRVWLGFEVYIQVMTSLSAVLAWTYVARFGFKSPWRANAVGRSIMYLMLSLAVIFTLISTSFIFGEYAAREAVRTVIYSSMPLVLIEFVRVLVELQHKRERGEIPAARVDGRL